MSMRNELKSAAFKDLFLKYFILFIVIVAGIFAGFFISVKSGLTEQYSNRVPSPSQLNNTTTLKVGEQFPSLEVYDLQDNPIDFSQLLEGHKTIVGILSAGCSPCEAFVQYFEESDLISSKEYRVLLLSFDRDYFAENFSFQAFKLLPEIEDDLSINVYPTIVGVGEDLTIRFVSSGFSGVINEKFIQRNL